MVISIQNYVVPVATESVKSTPHTSQLTPFQTWLLTVADLAQSARMFLVIACIFNLFYAPVAFIVPVVIPFIFTSLWISFAIVGVVILSYVAYVVASYLPRPEVTGSRDSAARESFLVTDVMKYFRGAVVKTADLDGSKQYIFGFHPHGILPMASFWAHNSEEWSNLFKTPKRAAVTLIASHLFKLPFMRDFLVACGAREVSRVAFERALTQGKSVFLVPGGMREMQYSTSTAEDIYICNSHKGFVRMAIKHGVDLVPVYSFGETKLLDGAFPKLQKWCWKYIGMPFPLFVGRWGLPFPRQQPVSVVVGSPIHVTQNPDPTPEQVDELAVIYFASLNEIFEKHKAAYGHENSKLIFIS